jgi:hypothetical protein
MTPERYAEALELLDWSEALESVKITFEEYQESGRREAVNTQETREAA